MAKKARAPIKPEALKVREIGDWFANKGVQKHNLKYGRIEEVNNRMYDLSSHLSNRPELAESESKHIKKVVKSSVEVVKKMLKKDGAKLGRNITTFLGNLDQLSVQARIPKEKREKKITFFTNKLRELLDKAGA